MLWVRYISIIRTCRYTPTHPRVQDVQRKSGPVCGEILHPGSKVRQSFPSDRRHEDFQGRRRIVTEEDREWRAEEILARGV